MSASRPNLQGSGPGPQRVPTGTYTQVNILFPSEQVELPPADKFKEFPPEAQKAILVAFDREQIERHGWLKNQQAYDHQLNVQSESHFFIWRMTGAIAGAVLAIVTLLAGAWLVKNGATGIGATSMILAAASLVGTAIYGHRALSVINPKGAEPETPEQISRQ